MNQQSIQNHSDTVGSSISEQEVTRYRASFPLLQTGMTYFDTPTMALPSVFMDEAMRRFMDQWKKDVSSIWFTDEGWFTQLDILRRQFAMLIGASLHEVALLSNVSACLSSIVNAFTYLQRDNVVMAKRGEFQTLAPQWSVKDIECRYAQGIERVGTSVEAFKAVVDARTAFVATSRVDHDSGYFKDVAGLSHLAHSQGAYLLLDDYQAGHLPINVHEQNVDVLVTGAGKWLLGASGIAFIYIRESLLEVLHPTTTGWFGNRNQLASDTSFRFREDARMVEMGTPAMSAVYTASAGLHFIEEVGITRIGERCLALARDLKDQCLEQGWRLRSADDPARQSAIVCIELDLPQRAIQQIVEQLKTRYRIFVGARTGAIRVGLHFFNTSSEIAYLVDALADILDEFIV